MEYLIKKEYRASHGLDLRSSDLNRGEDFASDMLNAQYRKSGGVEKRQGYQPFADKDKALYGLYDFKAWRSSTQSETAQVIAINTGLSQLAFDNLYLTYSGAASTVLVSVYYDPVGAQYYLDINENGTVVLHFAMGVPWANVATPTMAALSTALAALPSYLFTGVITGVTTGTVPNTGTIPACFMRVVREFDLVLNAGKPFTTIGFWVDVPFTQPAAGGNPFDLYHSKRNDDSFENMSAVQINNVLFLSNGGYGPVYKYDGQNLYAAGLPTPGVVLSTVGAAGAITGNNYVWAIQYKQMDAAGNIVESNVVYTTPPINLAAQKGSVTIPYIGIGSGFNTDAGVVSGNYTGNVVPINPAQHTLVAGDTAYFFDRASAKYVTRNIISVTGSSITISGAAVTVNTGDVISNNLRVSVFRSKSSGSAPTVFYLIEELPNNPFGGSTYTDNTTDAGLGARLIPPVTDRSAPNSLAYLAEFQGQMVGCGGVANRLNVFWSDVESPEYFPIDDNGEVINAPSGESVTGCAKISEVFEIFTQNTITTMSGELDNNNIRFDNLTHEIGCIAHQTIREDNAELFFWSAKGPMRLTSSGLPRPLGVNADGGGRMQPVMRQDGLPTEQVLQFKRSLSCVDINNEHYITFIPAETSLGGEKYHNDFSIVYVYDYARDSWLKWDNMQCGAGMVYVEGETYFSERTFNVALNAITHGLYRRMHLNDAWDYEDNTVGIDWDYAPQWEFLGEAAVLKKYLKIRVYQMEETPNNVPTLNCVQEADFISGFSRASFSFSPLANGGYGISAYGVDAYGDPGDFTDYKNLAHGRYKAARVRFQNSDHQENVIVNGWDTEMVTPYEVKFTK